jgi:hypothetical protein
MNFVLIVGVGVIKVDRVIMVELVVEETDSEV